MENKNCICILYNNKDSYWNLIIKEFLIMIGFQVFSTNNINNVMNSDNVISINNSISNSLFNIDCSCLTKEEDVINIVSTYFNVEELGDIYIKHRLYCLLYEYTKILAPEFEEKITDFIISELKEAIKDIELLEINQFSIFSKLYLISRLNEFTYLCGRYIEYNLDEILLEVDDIYKYDSNFFRTEWLRAKLVHLDLLKNPYERFYLEKCTNKSTNKNFNNEYLYDIAKLSEKKFFYARALRLCENILSRNDDDIKTLFRIGKIEKITARNNAAIEYLRKIIKVCRNIGFDYLEPMYLEYLFKSNYLISTMQEDGIKDLYKQDASEVKNYISTCSSNIFFNNLYDDNLTDKNVRSAMLKRIPKIDNKYIEKF